MELNIPTAIPLVYEFDENFKVLGYNYLADPEELEAQINKVKAQTAKKEWFWSQWIYSKINKNKIFSNC